MDNKHDVSDDQANLPNHLEGLADHVAAVLRAHGISVQLGICAEVAREVIAAGGPVLTKAAFEEIAEGWDECRYPDAMIDDIGAGLRRDFERLAVQAPADVGTKGGALSPAPPASALVSDLAALVRQLVHALSKAKPGHALAARSVDFLSRKGLAGNPLRAAAAQEAPAPNYVVHNVLQDAANMAHAYGQPELYTKLKSLMAALVATSKPGIVDEIALEAATAILPMYLEKISGEALQSKVQAKVSETILRAAGEFTTMRHVHALDELGRLHSVVNTAALRLREATFGTLATRLEDSAASVEIVLRAPVVLPSQE